MKKLFVVLSSLLLAGSVVAAEIGDNFSGGGYALGGSANYFSNEGYSSFSLSPSVTFFAQDNVSINAGFFYRSDSTDYSFTELFLGGGYVFGYDAEAQSGLAQRVGGNVWYNLTDQVLTFRPFYRADYFLTPTVSLFAYVNPVNVRFAEGVDEPIDLWLDASVGVSFYVPNRLKDFSKLL